MLHGDEIQDRCFLLEGNGDNSVEDSYEINNVAIGIQIVAQSGKQTVFSDPYAPTVSLGHYHASFVAPQNRIVMGCDGENKVINTILSSEMGVYWS